MNFKGNSTCKFCCVEKSVKFFDKIVNKIKGTFWNIINLSNRYKYGKERSDLKIEIGVQKKKLYLELGPSFNYKKEHKLAISLHSESREIINLKFNIFPEEDGGSTTV
jgi:hypothetical protein